MVECSEAFCQLLPIDGTKLGDIHHARMRKTAFSATKAAIAGHGRYTDAVIASASIRQLAPDSVTHAMNRVCEQVDGERDGFVSAAARRILERVEW